MRLGAHDVILGQSLASSLSLLSVSRGGWLRSSVSVSGSWVPGGSGPEYGGEPGRLTLTSLQQESTAVRRQMGFGFKSHQDPLLAL